MSWPRAFWINLDRATRRRAYMLAWLERVGWHDAERVVAFDKESVARVARYREEVPAKEAACIASHLRAIERAYASGVEQALILEDDVRFFSEADARQPFAALAPQAPWGILQLTVLERPPVLDWLYRSGKRWLRVGRRCWWCLGAYVITRPAMAELLARYRRADRFDLTAAPAPCEAYIVVMHSTRGRNAAWLVNPAPFVTGELPSELHPEYAEQQRQVYEFARGSLPALRAGAYRSPFPLWRRVAEDVRALIR